MVGNGSAFPDTPVVECLCQPGRTLQPGQLLLGHPAGSTCVVTGHQGARRPDDGGGEVGDVVHETVVRNVDPPHHIVYLDVQAGLFPHLSTGRLPKRLTGLDPSPGNGPQTLRRRLPAFDDDDAATAVRHDRTDAGNTHRPILSRRSGGEGVDAPRQGHHGKDMHEALTVVDPVAAMHDGFIKTLAVPLWIPWPPPHGWSFAGLAHVSQPGPDVAQRTLDGTVTVWAGPDPFGDPIEGVFVCEEAGAGVGGRFAGLSTHYPSPGVGEGWPHAQFEVDGRTVSLWTVEGAPDRAVYAGEAAGRWLWVILHPAEASAIVVQPPTLVDARTLGAELAVLPLGELSPRLLLG